MDEGSSMSQLVSPLGSIADTRSAFSSKHGGLQVWMYVCMNG